MVVVRGCGAHRSVLQKSTAKCACEENRVGRQMNNGKNRVPSHKKESGLPPLAQGVPLAVRVGHAIRLDGQELVNLDAVELEVQSAGGHVHTHTLARSKPTCLTASSQCSERFWFQ